MLGLSTFFLWQQNSKLSALIQAFELRNKEKTLAKEALQINYALQTGR